MVRFFIIILTTFVVIGAGTLVVGGNNAEAKVIVYYFHGSFRCPTCTNIEKFSKQAIETNFKDALISGRLEFKSVDVEERGNEHFVNDYKLYTKSLVLSMLKNGKEVKSKNLDKIWELAQKEQKFMDYVAREARTFIEDAQ
jgi:hypothetical protein